MTRPTLHVRRGNRIWARRCATEPTARTSLLAAVRRPRLLGREARGTATHSSAPGEVQGSRLLPAAERSPRPDVFRRRASAGPTLCRFVVSAPAGSAESNLIFLGPSASFGPVHLDRPPRNASPNQVSAKSLQGTLSDRGRARVCSKRGLTRPGLRTGPRTPVQSLLWTDRLTACRFRARPNTRPSGETTGRWDVHRYGYFACL